MKERGFYTIRPDGKRVLVTYDSPFVTEGRELTPEQVAVDNTALPPGHKDWWAKVSRGEYDR